MEKNLKENIKKNNDKVFIASKDDLYGVYLKKNQKIIIKSDL